MRRIHIFYNFSKAIRQLNWSFTNFVRVVNLKLFLFWFALLQNNFMNSNPTKHGNQHWKFWRKYLSVSYSFSCIRFEKPLGKGFILFRKTVLTFHWLNKLWSRKHFLITRTIFFSILVRTVSDTNYYI